MIFTVNPAFHTQVHEVAAEGAGAGQAAFGLIRFVSGAINAGEIVSPGRQALRTLFAETLSRRAVRKRTAQIARG